ncbi:hypothetical protein [Aquisalibacillus elongatus]|uniref:Uncharacterized protein n=1 Tax=Aquisalibacillus elongatus TaxID=485577 RepID=A0A3N5BUB8_9BACI|nr:hypothetical protein [Aquisalibacillus elongatus]RPF53368.1 hypothetical protein EDC24_1867 [Aquisalibacillus elongatus]
MSTHHNMSFFIRFIGIMIILIGGITGFMAASTQYGFMWEVALMWWFYPVLGGMLLIGISEVIVVLHKTKNSQEEFLIAINSKLKENEQTGHQESHQTPQ